jgi:hypothetical protein
VQVELTIHVGAEEADDEELAALTAQLRFELLDLDVEGVDNVVVGQAPPGSKGLEPLVIGALLVRLAKSAPVLAGIGATLQSWLSRRSGRTIRLSIDGDEIQVTDLSTADQRRLMEVWIARHQAK